MHRATPQVHAGRNAVSMKAFESLKDELQSQRSLLLSLNKSIQTLLSSTVAKEHADSGSAGANNGALDSVPVEQATERQEREVLSTRNSSTSKLPALPEGDQEPRYLD